MVCSDCIYKNKCYYGPLEEWEERFLYPPCVYLSEYHVDYIRDKSFKAIDDYEFWSYNMKTFKINDEIQIFTFDDGRMFALLSFCYDVNFLEQIYPSASLKIVRSGTFAYCYDFLANIEEK